MLTLELQKKSLKFTQPDLQHNEVDSTKHSVVESPKSIPIDTKFSVKLQLKIFYTPEAQIGSINQSINRSNEINHDSEIQLQVNHLFGEARVGCCRFPKVTIEQGFTHQMEHLSGPNSVVAAEALLVLVVCDGQLSALNLIYVSVY